MPAGADKQADQRGEANGEHKNCPVDGNGTARGNSGGLSARNGVHGGMCARTIPGRRRHRKQQSFDERLADEPASGKLQVRPHREFGPPRSTASQQQVRYVHARDREKQDDGPDNRKQSRPDAACEFVLQRVHDEAILKGCPGGRGNSGNVVRAMPSSSFLLALVEVERRPQPTHHAQSDAPIRGH